MLHTGGTSGGVEGEDGLDGDVHGGRVEGLEHDLGHLLSVGLGVEGGLGQEDGVLLRGDTELVVEGVVPDLLHVIPVGDDSVLDRVLEGENTSLRLSLISDVRVLLSHTDHHSLMTGSSHDRRKHSAGSVISRKTGLKKELNATNIHELFNFKNHFTHRAENQYKNNHTLHIPDLLSTTRAATSSSHIVTPFLKEQTMIS